MAAVARALVALYVTCAAPYGRLDDQRGGCMLLQKSCQRCGDILARLGVRRRHRGHPGAREFCEVMLIEAPANDSGRIDNARCERRAL